MIKSDYFMQHFYRIGIKNAFFLKYENIKVTLQTCGEKLRKNPKA